MAKYVVIRTIERETVVIGRTPCKHEAEEILEKDFKEFFWKTYADKNESSFEEVYEENEDDGCYLSKDSAWINDYSGDINYDWEILDTQIVDIQEEPLSMKELLLLTTGDKPYVEGNVIIDMHDMVGNGFEEFLDLISIKCELLIALI